MKPIKFWIALGENPYFTRDDHYLFYVFYTGQKNGSGYPLMPKFVQADDLEAARAKLHKFVDETIDHAKHMAVVEEKVKKEESYEIEVDEQSNSLTIAEVGKQDQSSKSVSAELKDLFGDIQ